MDDDFIIAFWQWFDTLPEKTKHLYMYNDIDIAYEIFRLNFYENSESIQKIGANSDFKLKDNHLSIFLSKYHD
jgi:hypothetical protein